MIDRQGTAAVAILVLSGAGMVIGAWVLGLPFG